MAVGGGADVVVVGDAHPVPQAAEFCGNFVGELLRGFTRGFGGALDLLSVLVGAGEEPSVKSHGALATCNRVARDSRVRVPDVRTGVDVVNRGRDVKLFHEKSSLV